ncbi:MAG: PQQ-binding-like beta-propeller repeat protein [Candidatus Sericytochromatia bacterium]
MFSWARVPYLILLAGLSACQAAPPFLPSPAENPVQPVGSSENALPAPSQPLQTETKRLRPLRFRLRFDDPAFRIACGNCRVRYARLEIKRGNLSTPIYAVGSDENGFTPVEDNATGLLLTAQVPEGSNWVAYAGLYGGAQANQTPIMEVGGAFHVGDASTPEEVELSLRALQTAQVIDSLHTIGSEKVYSPLDLIKFQALSDQLLGVEPNGDGTYTLGRMPGARNGEDLLDATTIAQMLDAGSLDLERPTEAAELPLQQLTPRPQVLGTYRARSFTGGMSKLVMDPLSLGIFGFDFLTGQRQIYGLNLDLQTPVAPYNLGEMRNTYLSLGRARAADETDAQEEPAYYAYLYSGLNRMTLSAYAQNRQKRLWSHEFAVDATYSDYVPTVWRRPADGQNPAADRVYVVLNADRFNHPQARGLYALENGQVKWTLPLSKDENQQNIFTSGFNTAGALSPSGEQLHLISVSIPGQRPSELVALNTVTPALSWRHSLEEATYPTSTPAVGHSGTIYVHSVDTRNQSQGQTLPGHLTAVSATGERLWRSELPVSAPFPPVVDYRNGQDMIYSLGDTGLVSAFDGSGQLRWQFLLPGTAGEGPVDSPLIGEDLGNGRTLYFAMGNGLIYALRDGGNAGELLWAQAPGGKVARGMVLHNGSLYAPTLDGGEGQFVQIKRVQVHSLGLPSAAPWPLNGGNLAGTGHGHAFYQAGLAD